MHDGPPKETVEREGVSSTQPDFKLLARNVLEEYHEALKPGGSEREAIEWIEHAFRSGRRHVDMSRAIKAYARHLTDKGYARSAANFFSLDGERYHWEQFITRANIEPPPVRGFEEALSLLKRRGK
jgi:hypothetical protein